ncbi:MAG: hypothetical protein GJ676_00105 [Rhodobacteraceae bacterium]|nr:hypothetical protein [Paracoccaceae bacterium]
MVADPQAFAAWLAQAPSSADWIEARLSFLDTLGCIAAGARAPALPVLRQMGMSRAVLSAVAGHFDDFDDSELIGSTHPSTVLISALIELDLEKPMTLGQALDAYEAGLAAIEFIGAGLGYDHYARGFHASATVGIFGAAAACARVLKLDSDRIAVALSLAASQAAGLKVQFGSDAKGLQLGFAAEAGLRSARLAQAGLSASDRAVDIFLKLYGVNRTAAVPQSLTIPPGRIYRKLWPCCHYAHRLLQVCQGLDLPPDRIRRIDLQMPAPFLKVIEIQDPRTASAAKFSLRWCIAAMLTGGELCVTDFETRLHDPDLRVLMSRIDLLALSVRDGIADLSPEAPDRITITCDDGHVIAETAAHVPGSTALPIAMGQLVTKYRGNLALAKGASNRSGDLLRGAADLPFRSLIPEPKV